MTFRNPNIKTEFQGVRYVQGVIQDNHSIFQSLSRENDQGNDLYASTTHVGFIAIYRGVFDEAVIFYQRNLVIYYAFKSWNNKFVKLNIYP